MNELATLFAPLTYDEANEQLKFENSFSRMAALWELQFAMSTPDWLRMFGEFWEASDNLGQFLSEEDIGDVHHFDEGGPFMEMMTAEEQSFFSSLPDELIVYRGCTALNKWGASWSLDRGVAESFPFLNRYHHRENRPLLVKARIQKSKISAIKLGRNESEVVCLFELPKHISTSTALDKR